MAASLSEIYPKRKLELEDITNRHKKAKGKEYFQPVQERSPSPSSPSSSSPHKPRQKSVSFELSRNEHYENSPLLTPKEDDYDSEPHEEEPEPAKPQQLDKNPDYVALAATADMLASTKAKIEDDLTELSALRKAAKFESKSALVDFYVRLICPDASSSSESKSHSKASDLPQQHRIVSAPSVNWAKYHPGLQNASLSHDCTNDYEKVFKGLHMFPN
ncbi:uncharacterized protein CXQ87_004950 [Candidozyma duobushaemuli]|uniref:Uncharacterized protein n=2 Tax=Candidozyma TaxID=3303203 RepID=A0ABX8IAW3_9ASCO|nr:uncharacterized protein CXQ87_004950 [[Candida] duobushaemulonis]PVH16654.1 hypothetical protein CXQ87_004950 [[Candida] duobushaemulonis]QWU90405.1 hypothetical protein CA3LBN_004766 [[Candida] haemuloni]